MKQQEQQQQSEGPPPEIRTALRIYSKLDEDVKKYGKSARQARKILKENKALIIEWMTRAGFTKLGRKSDKSGPVVFVLVEKDVYVRPTQEQQSACMARLMREGITDPMQIIKELKSCAGTRKEVRLYRKKPRKSRKKPKKAEGEEDVDESEQKPKKRKKVTFVEEDKDS
jgi:hypothetical protein